MNRRPLVILGGMGPQASARFQQLVLQKSESHHTGKGDQYPYIVHYSLPVRDFISDTASQPAAIATLVQLTEPMTQLNPSCITLACNTAHLLAPQVSYLGQPPFLSMISTVVNHCKRQGLQRVALAATPTTIRSKLYESALTEKGITCLLPTARQLEQLEAVIRRVIAGTLSQADHAALRDLSVSFLSQGAEALLLGCTELPLAYHGAPQPLPILDCLDLYATDAVAEYYLYNKG